jgi:hypothetical protein
MKKLKDFFYHLFIPNEKNNYKAKSLQTDFLFIYLFIAILLNFTFKKINLVNVLGFATDITINKLYQLTNLEREKRGLPDLSYSEKLSQAAYQKAQDMFTKNYWAHYAPDGKTPWDFILSSGYTYEYAGENLAKNFLFSDGVVTAWMNSPTHRDNILKKEYTDVGFAIVNGVLNGEETTLVVQMFGKPLYKNIAKEEKPPEVIKTKNEINTPNLNPEKTYVNSQKPAVLSKNTKNIFSDISKFIFSINFVFLSFLLVALFFDFYFAEKFNLLRIEGKNLAHFIFIFFVLLGLLIISKGAII